MQPNKALVHDGRCAPAAHRQAVGRTGIEPEWPRLGKWSEERNMATCKKCGGNLLTETRKLSTYSFEHPAPGCTPVVRPSESKEVLLDCPHCREPKTLVRENEVTVIYCPQCNPTIVVHG